jgi:hypothetical protein
MKGKELLCLIFLALQLKVVINYILVLSPMPGGWGIWNERAWLILYILFGIAGLLIKNFTKVKYNWVLYYTYDIIILYSIIFTFILHESYYNEYGYISISLHFINRNPIMYYANHDQYPPEISVIYGLLLFNTLVLLLTYFINKRHKRKNTLKNI